MRIRIGFRKCALRVDARKTRFNTFYLDLRLRVDRPLDCNETTCNSDPHCQEPVRLITHYFALQ